MSNTNSCLSVNYTIEKELSKYCVLNIILCDKMCQWLSAGRWFFPVSPTNKTDRQDIAEISLKEALTLTPILTCSCISSRDTNNKTMASDQNNKSIKKIWGLMSQFIFETDNYFGKESLQSCF
jgi:hypothetical protein